MNKTAMQELIAGLKKDLVKLRQNDPDAAYVLKDAIIDAEGLIGLERQQIEDAHSKVPRVTPSDYYDSTYKTS